MRPGSLLGRMYEDASIELDAFGPGGRVFCIASAGCTAMRLAPHHEVVAVNVNPARFFGPLAGWWPSHVRAFLKLDDPVEQLEYWRRQKRALLPSVRNRTRREKAWRPVC